MTRLRCLRGVLLLVMAAVVTEQQIVYGEKNYQDGDLFLNDDSSGLNLTCTPSAVTVFVYWDPIIDTDSYDVTWTNKEGNEGADSTNLTYFLILNTIPCTDYDVTVVAKLGELEVANETITTRTLDQAPPSVFSVVVNQVGTEPILNVTWKPVPSPGNCEVNYMVSWTQTNITDEVHEDVTADPYYVIKDLTYCTSCDVCVIPFTDEHNATEKCNNDPVAYSLQPVTELDVTQEDEQPELEVTWTYLDTVPEECDLQYKVTWNHTDEVNSQTDNTDDLSYTITNLTYCLDYNVCVMPYVSGQEANATCRVEPIIATHQPVTELDVTQEAEQPELEVTWTFLDTVPEECDLQYKVTWQHPGEVNSQTDNTDNLSYTIKDLIYCLDYNVCVMPYVSGQVATATCREEPIIAIPEAPSNLNSTKQTQESITVQWEEPPKKGECVVVGYNITWLEDMEPESLEGDKREYDITNLDPESEYTIILVAQYEAGWGLKATLTERTKDRDQEGGGGDPNVGAIVGGVIGGLVLVAIIVAAVVKRKKLKKMVTKNNKKNKSISTQNITDHHSSNIQLQDNEGHTRNYNQYS